MNFFQIIASINSIGSTVIPTEPTNPTAQIINPVSSDFAYTLYDREDIGFNRRSAFAVLKITTDANSLNVSYYSPLADANYTLDAIVSVYDDLWNYVGSINPDNATGKFTKSIDLSGVDFRTYYFVEAGNTHNGTNDFKGTSITKIEAATGTIGMLTIPKSTNRIVAIGDSISVGDGSTQNSKYGWEIRLRDALRVNDWSITSEGWGAAYTLGMFSTATRQQEGADRAIAEFTGATGRKVIIWVLGTNDFGYIVGDPTAVGIASASLWDKAYAQDNEIEVIVLTPIYRTNQDTLNSGGWVLNDYRSALTNEANSRAFVRVYDGEPVVSVGNYTDNVHPNNTGHQQISDYIQSIL